MTIIEPYPEEMYSNIENEECVMDIVGQLFALCHSETEKPLFITEKEARQ